MSISLYELKEQLLSQGVTNLDAFEGEWMSLQADFESTESGSVHGRFKLSAYPYTAILFKNAVETGNQVLYKLFFEAKLVDMEALIASLYPEAVNDQIRDSLFYICVAYDMDRKDPMFLDLCFEGVPESELPQVIQSFKELHIPTLERVNEVLAQKILVYLANEKYLDLESEIISAPAEKRWQRAFLSQIIDCMFHQQELSERQVNFLKQYNRDDFIDYLTIAINADGHTLDEIANLLDNSSLQEILGQQQCQELDAICYRVHLGPSMEFYQKNLLTSAKEGNLENFKKNWEPFFSLYQNYKQRIERKLSFNSVCDIFRNAVKNGNIQIVDLISKHELFTIDFYRPSPDRDEPISAFNMLALAAFNRDKEMLSFLLGKGASLCFAPQKEKGNYSSPLAIAIDKGNPDIVNLLLKKGITVWDENQNFVLSPIFAAIVSDYQNSKESGYYLTLLLNKLELDSQLKAKLNSKFISDYIPILGENYSREIVQWTYRFLLNRSYFNLDAELTADYDCYRDPLLERVVRLNLENTGKQVSTIHRSFLSSNKKTLNKLIVGWIKDDLFSPQEIDQVLNHPIIFSYLNNSTQAAIRNTYELNNCKNKPLTLAILGEIFKSLDESLRKEKNKSTRKIVDNIIFYQEIYSFSKRVECRAHEKATTSIIDKSHLELDADEIETLLVIVEDFKRKNTAPINHGYIQYCLWAVKKFCSTSTLSLRVTKPVGVSVATEILPEQYQEKINQIKVVANSLKKVCIDGEAVLAFMEHLITDRSKIAQFFQEKYAVYSFEYKDLKKYTVALHTENIPRGDLEKFQNFINRLIREYIAVFDIASAAGLTKEFFEKFSGLCIEGRLRGCLNWVANLDRLPKFDDVMQKAITQYEAYTKVMQPDVLEDIKNFPLSNEDEKYDEHDVTQAAAFIFPRVVGTACLFEDPENHNKSVEKVISESDVEEYLKNILIYSEENPYVFVDNPYPKEEFEVVDHLGYDHIPATEQTHDPRLNPTLLENLLLSYIEGPGSKGYKVDEGSVEVLGQYKTHTGYKKLSQADKLPIFAFQVTRDSKKNDQTKNLPFINDVVIAFLNKNPQENAKLLMPMAQCRTQLGKNKQHYVLVEITINGVNKEIVIHNSQSKWSTIGYLNCLNDLDDFKFKEHNKYGQQKDNFSCGLFVYRYIKAILESGNAEQLKGIKASLADPCLNLDKIINDDFSVMNNNFEMRKITGSENVPWERKELEKFLDKQYAENLNNLDQEIDFPNKSEDKQGSSSPDAQAGQLVSGSAFFSKSLNPSPVLATDEIAQIMSAINP